MKSCGRFWLKKFFNKVILIGTFGVLLMSNSMAKERARDLNIPFEGSPGKTNAITDVKGIEVGYTTLISGDPKNPHESIVRTGVTAIFPRGKSSRDPVFAGAFSLNGNGEMTGSTWIEEAGVLSGPVMLTNTHSVGLVRDSVIAWQVKRGELKDDFSLPVVTETWDGYLNDINGQHIHPKDVFHALESAKTGPIEEGNVGGGTGMRTFEWKGGTGTASRKLDAKDGGYTVGVLVQSNFGERYQAMFAGLPVGKLLPTSIDKTNFDEKSSIIVIVATDAPLIPTQLKRLAKRAALGVARTGGVAMNSSGDLMLAFSTANAKHVNPHDTTTIQMMPNEAMNPLFEATVYATEEAIINAIVAADTMTGLNQTTFYGISHEKLKRLFEHPHETKTPG